MDREAAVRCDAVMEGSVRFPPAEHRDLASAGGPGGRGAAAEMPWGGGGMRAQSRRGSDGLSGGCSPRLSLDLMKTVFS